MVELKNTQNKNNLTLKTFLILIFSIVVISVMFFILSKNNTNLETKITELQNGEIKIDEVFIDIDGSDIPRINITDRSNIFMITKFIERSRINDIREMYKLTDYIFMLKIVFESGEILNIQISISFERGYVIFRTIDSKGHFTGNYINNDMDFWIKLVNQYLDVSDKLSLMTK